MQDQSSFCSKFIVLMVESRLIICRYVTKVKETMVQSEDYDQTVGPPCLTSLQVWCFFFVLRPGKQSFGQLGTEPQLPGYLPVLWRAESVLLKDTKRRSWASNLDISVRNEPPRPPLIG